MGLKPETVQEGQQTAPTGIAANVHSLQGYSQTLLGLSNRVATSLEEGGKEENFGLAGLFWLTPDLDDVCSTLCNCP